MQHIWDHTFYKHLQVDPTECKILLTDPPLNPKGNRDRLLQTMFEQYGFAAAFIQIQAVLTLYAQGDDIVYIHSNAFSNTAMVAGMQACPFTWSAHTPKSCRTLDGLGSGFWRWCDSHSEIHKCPCLRSNCIPAHIAFNVCSVRSQYILLTLEWSDACHCLTWICCSNCSFCR